MPRGGKRPGGGRPKGAANKKTKALAEKVKGRGMAPLDVMLETMWRHCDAKRWDEAAAIARDAAPYLHSRKANAKDGGAPLGSPENPIHVNHTVAAILAPYADVLRAFFGSFVGREATGGDHGTVLPDRLAQPLDTAEADAEAGVLPPQ